MYPPPPFSRIIRYNVYVSNFKLILLLRYYNFVCWVFATLLVYCQLVKYCCRRCLILEQPVKGITTIGFEFGIVFHFVVRPNIFCVHRSTSVSKFLLKKNKVEKKFHTLTAAIFSLRMKNKLSNWHIIYQIENYKCQNDTFINREILWTSDQNIDQVLIWIPSLLSQFQDNSTHSGTRVFPFILGRTLQIEIIYIIYNYCNNNMSVYINTLGQH